MSFKHLKVGLPIDPVFKRIKSRKIGGMRGARRRGCYEKLFGEREILRQQIELRRIEKGIRPAEGIEPPAIDRDE